MPAKQLVNPLGAYGYTANQDYGETTLDCTASGTIKAGQLVAWASGGTVVVAGTAANSAILGAALDSAVSGGTLRVLVNGVTTLTGDAAIAALAQISFSTGTAGDAGAVSAVIGYNIGVALTACSGAAATFTAYIQKM